MTVITSRRLAGLSWAAVFSAAVAVPSLPAGAQLLRDASKSYIAGPVKALIGTGTGATAGAARPFTAPQLPAPPNAPAPDLPQSQSSALPPGFKPYSPPPVSRRETDAGVQAGPTGPEGGQLAAPLMNSGYLDMRKTAIETPVKSLIEVPPGADAEPVTSYAPAADSRRPGTDNPRVKPGLVSWHPDFQSACRAAESSGKPVLLFQMMGRLDDRFC